MKTHTETIVVFELEERESFLVDKILVTRVTVHVIPPDGSEDDEEYLDVKFSGWSAKADGTKRKNSSWGHTWDHELSKEWETRAKSYLSAREFADDEDQDPADTYERDVCPPRSIDEPLPSRFKR